MSAKIYQQLTSETITQFNFDPRLLQTAKLFLHDWVKLEKWQEVGISWLAKKELKHFRGLAECQVACGILGFAMGLGM